MDYFIEGACKSVIGKVRNNNEDNFCFNLNNMEEQNNGSEIITVKCTNEDYCTFAIFDGMGGEEKGERASYIASTILREYSKEHEHEEINWNQYVQLANDRICEEIYGKDRMGTTMAGSQFCKDYISISNIGDSRVYILKDEKLIQVSVDHNEAKLQEKFNINTNSKARLTQHLGIKKEEMIIQPYTTQIEYDEVQKLLICSDGITDMLSDKDIEEILCQSKISENAVEALIKKAMENGGIDNTTVMVFDILKKEEEKKFENVKSNSIINKLKDIFSA